MRKILDDRKAAGLFQKHLDRLNKESGRLKLIHAAQPWRLTFWKEARRHLSYRRFFEVTGLVGVRVEDDAVFDDVHRLVLGLVRDGHADGLRVDHVDGLADPKAYLDRLRREVGPDVYLIVEKILEADEALPADWPVDGTTGYEFIAALADALVDQEGLAALQEAYGEQAGRKLDPEREKREARRLMVRRNFEGELSALVAMASNLAHGPLPDDALRTAIVELLLAFPVYRTYGTAGDMPEADLALLDRVADDARDRGKAMSDALDFVLGLLRGDASSAPSEEALAFRTRFQQLTGPIMAKSVEDTFFYRFNPLIALNEVGGDPIGAGSLERFHASMAGRARTQPYGLSATATHDTKRGEDARARLYVLSEAPEVWAAAVTRWRAVNAGSVAHLAEGPAPGPGTEWMLYQALAGAWPDSLDPGDAQALGALRERFLTYAEKALREAKRRTDWLDNDDAYEGAVAAFAARLLSQDNRAFLDDFAETLAPFIAAGRLNSLAQILVKLAAPGIPDIYQGTEGADLSLVDPDNRRAPDFAKRAAALSQGGSSKQRLIAACLAARRNHPSLFGEGDYVPLEVGGKNRKHVIAFVRSKDDALAIAVAPRLTLGLQRDDNPAIAPDIWGDTAVELGEHRAECVDILTRSRLDAADRLPLRQLFETFPVALLVGRRR